MKSIYIDDARQLYQLIRRSDIIVCRNYYRLSRGVYKEGKVGDKSKCMRWNSSSIRAHLEVMRDKIEDSSKAECTTKSRRVEALSPQEDRSIKKRMILRRRGFGAIEKIRNACVNSGRVLIVLTGKKHRTVEAVPNQYRKTEQQQGDFGFVLGNTRRRNPKSYW